MSNKFVGAGKKLLSFIKPKANVPKTKLDKAKSNLDIAIHKNKASKAKLGQTIFEMQNPKFKGEDFTFKGNKGKSESNTESYKRIQGENTKVLKGMLDKATENKKDGGRMGYKVGGRIGLKHGSYETVPPSKGFSEYVSKEKQKKINAENKKANEKDKPGGAGPMGRAGGRAAVKVGGRMGYKDGTKSGRKMGGGSSMSNTSVKKKFKNLGNLPETIQIKIAGKKIAKKV